MCRSLLYTPTYVAGDFATAAALNRTLLPLTKALFVETNPVPAKAALALMGLCHGAVRLPLVGLLRDSEARLKAALLATEGVGPLAQHTHGVLPDDMPLASCRKE